MGKRVSPTMVGVFVLGGLALALVTILVLGSGRFFTGKTPFVLYFDRDVNGLRIGAPVKFKGVDIGQVNGIQLSLNGLDQASGSEPTIRIPVIIEIDSHKIARHGARDDLSSPEVMRHAIELGLRGQLRMQSYVTGLLYVDLDMHPGTPANFVAGQNGPYDEIPTLPTAFEQAQETLTKIIEQLDKADVPAMVASLMQAANSAANLLKSPELKASLQSLRDATADLKETSQSIRRLSERMSSQVEPLSQSLKQSSDAFGAALRQVQVSLAGIQHSVEPNSPLNYQLTHTLAQLSSAAQAVQELADYLQRNPSAVVRGRYTGDESDR